MSRSNVDSRMNFRRKNTPDVPEVDPELAQARRVAVHLVLALRERDAEISELRRQIEHNTAEVAAVRREVAGLPNEFDRTVVRSALEFVNERAVASESMLERAETLPVGALWANLPDTGTRGERKHAG